MKMKPKIIMVFIMISAILLFIGCNKNNPLQDLNNYVKKIKQRETIHKKNMNIYIPKLPTPVKYEANKLRSPFEAQNTQAFTKEGLSNPLQSSPLNVLRFVGTLSENNTTYAFISAPDNKIYQVSVGDLLGDHQGKITYISPDRIEVTEQMIEENKPATIHIETLRLKDENR